MDFDNRHELTGSLARVVRSRLARTPRVLSTAAAGIILLGSGVGIGVALTGGASAANGQPAAASRGAASASVHECARLARALASAGHSRRPHRSLASRSPRRALRVAALCRDPLLRLAAVGGMYGEVTFKTKDGTKTVAFERGTVQDATGSALVVRAADGTSMTWHIVAGSVVRQDGHRVPASKLTAGDLVFVGGQVIGGADDARLVRIRNAG
jgi:hypothetical protein